MVHNEDLGSLSPEMIGLLLCVMVTLSLSKVALQPASHRAGSDTKACFTCGKMCALRVCSGSLCIISSDAVSVECITVPLGRRAVSGFSAGFCSESGVVGQVYDRRLHYLERLCMLCRGNEYKVS